MTLPVPSSPGNRVTSRARQGTLPMKVTKFGLALAGLAFSATAAFAQDAFKPAIVYDLGGKFDKSFNEGVHTGAEKFKKETGTEYRDFEPQNDAQREQALRRFARDGYSPIVAVGLQPGNRAEEGRRGISRRPSSPSSTPWSRSRTCSPSCSRSMRARSWSASWRPGLQDRQGRLRRRHGHPAHPQVRLRLRPGREIRQEGRRGVPEHDRHHGRGLERSRSRAASSPRARSIAART